MYNNTKYTGNIQKNVDIRDISIIIVVPDQEIEYDHLRTDSRSCESRRCRVRPVIVRITGRIFCAIHPAGIC